MTLTEKVANSLGVDINTAAAVEPDNMTSDQIKNSDRIVWRTTSKFIDSGTSLSLGRRDWPTGFFKDKPVLDIRCTDHYKPSKSRGDQPPAPIFVFIADRRAGGIGFAWRQMKHSFTSLALAKAAGEAFFDTHPEWLPK